MQITEINVWASHIHSMEIHEIEKIEGNILTLKTNHEPKIQLVLENKLLREINSNRGGNITYCITNVFHLAFIEQQKKIYWFHNHKFSEDEISTIYDLLN